MLKLLPLEEDLIRATVAEISAPERFDFSRTCLVFPSQRIGVFLREALSRSVANNFFPPQLLAIDQFFSHLFQLNFPGYQVIDEIAACQLIYRSLATFTPAANYAGRQAAGFASFLPWGLELFRVLEEMLVESERWDKAAEVYREFVALGDYHRQYKQFIQNLPALAQSYLEMLQGKKQCSRGLQYRLVSEACTKGELDLPDWAEYLFLGFGVLNRCEEKLLRHIRSRAPTRFLVKSSARGGAGQSYPFTLLARTLNSIGLAEATAPTGATETISPAERIFISSCPNRETEMAAIFQTLQKLVSGKAEEELMRIGVVLPDPAALIPFIQGVVSRFDQAQQPIPFNITLGYPFARTPLFQLIDFLLRLQESARVEHLASPDFLNFIRHPYIKLSGHSTEVAEALRQSIHACEDIIVQGNWLSFRWQELMQLLPEKLSQGEFVQQVSLIQGELAEIYSFIRPESQLDLIGLCAGIQKLLERIGRAPKQHLFLPDTLECAKTILAEIRELTVTAADEFRKEKLADLAELMRTYFSRQAIYFHGSPLRGIQVMGLLEFRALSFDELIVADACEGTLPQTLKYDPLLPLDIRRIFGMRSHQDWEEIFALHFFTMVGSAKRVHIFYPQRQENGEESKKSRFLERILYERQKEQGSISPMPSFNLRFRPEERSLHAINKTAQISEWLKQTPLSPSALEKYVACPASFYYAHVLGLQERQELAAELEQDRIGLIIHDVLHTAYAQVADGAWPNQAVLVKIVAAAMAKAGYTPDSGLGRIQAWVIEQKLVDFLLADRQRMEKEKVGIVGLEKTVQGEFTCITGTDKFVLRGRIDRIEKEKQMLRIIDYKTGAPFAARLEPDALSLLGIDSLADQPVGTYLRSLTQVHKVCRSFQILVYILLYAQEQKVAAEEIDAWYCFLRSSNKLYEPVFQHKNSQAQYSETDKSLCLSSFRRLLGELLADLRQRDQFVPNPTADTCRYCAFRTPCGNL